MVFTRMLTLSTTATKPSNSARMPTGSRYVSMNLTQLAQNFKQTSSFAAAKQNADIPNRRYLSTELT